MNSLQKLRKLQELDSIMEQAVLMAHEIYGNVNQSEFTEELYSLMGEVKDDLEEVENEINE
ncbi:hypothetical protein [Bacillus wiedmannii]|uniref:hypothetical protein n=1 Tax=Bacillus wiedmannii TaxID=1890302 RepID=UPI000BF1A936|nr:hypothetical protein [Bacillus wiedmannii]PEN61596.1 hypothetical protein CN576_21410 [Bacillus wiedmannii]PHA62842.1 hypothetical protein COE75_16515 [Bacillus wiedmannii]